MAHFTLRRICRHTRAIAALSALTAAAAHATVDSQSNASSTRVWVGLGPGCGSGSSGFGYGVGWPIGRATASLNGTLYAYSKHSITDLKLGTVRSEVVAYAYPTPDGCDDSKVTHLRSLSFRVTDAPEPIDIAWLGYAQFDARGFARWTLKQTDAADTVIAGLTISASPTAPQPEGVYLPDRALDGRIRLLLPPGSYRLETYTECRTSNVFQRTLLSFDTDRDGRSDIAETCPTDLDGNGDTDFADLSLLLMDMGESGTMSDQDGSGTVDLADLALLIANVGPCPAVLP